jgi:hypothetical protein
MLIPAGETLVGYYARLGFALRGRMPAVYNGSPYNNIAVLEDIPHLSALYGKAFPNRAERGEDDWKAILKIYRVFMGEGGYTAGGTKAMEHVPPHEAPDNPCAACIMPLNDAAGRLLTENPPYINLLYN